MVREGRDRMEEGGRVEGRKGVGYEFDSKWVRNGLRIV